MPGVIVVEFTSLDGVVEDPDGAVGTPHGGWAARFGPEVFAGDKFDLGPLMETGTLVFGRTTWELFADRWPLRTTPFADRMNAARKVVASRSLADARAWSGSTVLAGDAIDALAARAASEDLVVVGSTRLVHQLVERDLVDEYRLLVLPVVLGTGVRLFPEGGPELRLQQVASSPAGAGQLLTYRRPAAPAPTA